MVFVLCLVDNVDRFNTPQTCKVELEVLGHKVSLAQVCLLVSSSYPPGNPEELHLEVYTLDLNWVVIV